MADNKIIFGEVESSDYGVYISGEAVFNAPERDVDMVDIPGRNGDLIIDKGTFNNIEVKYPAFNYEPTMASFVEKVDGLRNALCSRSGYQRLTDTIHTDEFRLGVYRSGLEVKPIMFNTAAQFDITFDCKPQRFLVSGETPQTASDWSDVETETGSIVTIEADDTTAIKDVTADIEPIQDLHGYDKPWVGGAGKNKLPTTTTQTVMGITFTANADGTVTANNTATAGADCYFVGASGVYDYISNITTGSYKLSGNTLGGGTSTFFIVEEGGTILAQQTDGNDATVTLDSTKKYRIFIRVNSGKTLSNQKYYPMLRKSTDSATFEPYENICPISGHTDVVVSRASGQLIDTSTNESGAIDASGNEVANATFNRTDFIPIDKARICIKTNLASGYVIRVHGYSASKAWVQQIKAITTDGTNMLVEEGVPSGVAYVRLSYPLVGVNNTELWQADTYTTALGTTVYGGTLDVTTGVLTVTHGYLDLGTVSWERWGTVSNTKYRFVSSAISSVVKKPSSQSVVPNIVCSDYEAVIVTYPWDEKTGITIHNSNGNIIIYDPRYADGSTDATTFKSAMNGVQLVYELATPTTTTLTPQEISTLLGENNVWASSGDVTVEYGVPPFTNPTMFPSNPLIKVTGIGTLTVGDTSIVITGTASQVIYIDCESMEIYKIIGGVITPAGSLVSFSTPDFPKLMPGINTVTMGTGITDVEITPRWWRI